MIFSPCELKTRNGWFWFAKYTLHAHVVKVVHNKGRCTLLLAFVSKKKALKPRIKTQLTVSLHIAFVSRIKQSLKIYVYEL